IPATRRVVVPELAASSTSTGSVRPARPGPSTHTSPGATSTTRAPSASTIRRVARQSAESATLRAWLVPSASAPHISVRWLIDLSPGTCTVPRTAVGLMVLSTDPSSPALLRHLVPIAPDPVDDLPRDTLVRHEVQDALSTNG